MPVEFLTDAKAGAYGRFPATVSDAQLAEYFHAAADEEAILERRMDHNRLGFRNPARHGAIPGGLSLRIRRTSHERLSSTWPLSSGSTICQPWSVTGTPRHDGIIRLRSAAATGTSRSGRHRRICRFCGGFLGGRVGVASRNE